MIIWRSPRHTYVTNINHDNHINYDDGAEWNMDNKRTPTIGHIITITTYQRQSLGSIYRGISTTSTTIKYHPPYSYLPDSPSPWQVLNLSKYEQSDPHFTVPYSSASPQWVHRHRQNTFLLRLHYFSNMTFNLHHQYYYHTTIIFNSFLYQFQFFSFLKFSLDRKNQYYKNPRIKK